VARRLVFDPHIPDDLAGALDYYEPISSKLANRFRRAVNRRLDDVAERPESFPLDVPPIRFAKIARFPYVFFFVEKPESVSILAIIHGASDPAKWRDRQTEQGETG